jgi:hypothetical protein
MSVWTKVGYSQGSRDLNTNIDVWKSMKPGGSGPSNDGGKRWEMVPFNREGQGSGNRIVGSLPSSPYDRIGKSIKKMLGV